MDHRSNLTLTATATNSGPNVSSSPRVVLSLPTGLSFASATASQGSCASAAGAVTCDLGVLATSGRATVTVTVAASDIGTFVPSVQMTGVGVEPAPGNNTAMASIVSNSVADASVQVARSADPATAGQSLQYTATLGNAGPDTLTSPTVAVSVNGSTLASATSGQGTCVISGNGATCALNAVAVGGTAAVTFTTAATVAGTVTASANITVQGTTDPSAANNSATQSTVVAAAPPTGGGSNGGGGGGGSLDLLTPILLLAALAPLVSKRVSRDAAPR